MSIDDTKRCPACGMDNIHTMYCGHKNMENIISRLEKLEIENLKLKENIVETLEILGNGLSNAMSRNAALNIINDALNKLNK